MNVFTKSTIRKPLKTVLMLALLALMSFGFMARAVELMVINSEIGRLSQYYRPVGTLTPGAPQDYFISDGASLIAQAPELDFMDVNRECSGIMDGVYSADIDGYTEYNNIMYLYGSLLSTQNQ